MNLQTLVKGIEGIIPGGLSVKDFSMATQTSEDVASGILDNFMQNGIGRFEDDQIHFEESDRLKTSILAINMGAAIEEVSRLLKWQDFESLTAEILEKQDFEITKNVILTKPRMQIDVVGIKSDVAILVDCKHWKNMTQSALQSAVKKQIERTKQYLVKEDVESCNSCNCNSLPT